MLGTDLGAALRQAGYQVVLLDLPEVDITRPADLERGLAGADAVINCAAYTDVDGAEAQGALAQAVNQEAVGVLGRLAAARGLYVVHLSTDFVFDGALARPYRETDLPHPLSVYGATKWGGELALQAAGCPSAIVRVEWTYGRARASFVSKVLARAAAGVELTMVTDQVGAPTWTGDVAAALTALLAQRATGLFHYAAAGYASRYEVAQAILELRGLTGIRLRPCRTADIPAVARRPLNSRFDCAAIDARLRGPRPPWREALARFLGGAGNPPSAEARPGAVTA